MLTDYPKYLRKAYEFAVAHDYDYNLRTHHCAVLVKGGTMLGVGYNGPTTNSFVEYYADRARGPRAYSLSTHAELDVIQRYRKKTDLTGSKLYVFRRSFDPTYGVAAMSRPCPICALAIQDHGISRVVYSISDAEYGVMAVSS